ncbi:MAG: hypothetical protein CMD52_04495, partial [Gammaproteobacteria bacterium]|nr:hypothetical protein [Gammaproteobacteria bacterium]
IPLPDNSVKTVYTSHMFEHLSRNEGILFLQEVKRVLMDNGILRISVPDLEKYISRYNKTKNADEFMEGILVNAPPISTLLDKIKLVYTGYRHHQCMYDGNSLSKLLHSQGFRDVTIQIHGNTLIENSENLNLHEREEQSVYVEARK